MRASSFHPATTSPVRSISGTKRGRPAAVPARETSTSAEQLEQVRIALPGVTGSGVRQDGQINCTSGLFLPEIDLEVLDLLVAGGAADAEHLRGPGPEPARPPPSPLDPLA